MADLSSDYSRAYETAKRELAELIIAEERLARRKVELRKTIEVLGALCESEGIEIERSPEAALLLADTGLADEIRTILGSHQERLRPHQIKTELEQLGHDLSRYGNPQATIQMVLKRMTESREVEETTEDGKKTYRYRNAYERFMNVFPTTVHPAYAGLRQKPIPAPKPPDPGKKK